MKIIYADNNGGVKTVSRILHRSLCKYSIRANLFNINDYGDSLVRMIFNSLKEIKKLDKKEIFILQHFTPIFLGLFMRAIGYKKLINVVHTDLVTYYQSVSFIKKFIIWLMFYLNRNEKIVFVSKEAELKAKELFRLTNTSTIYNIYDFDAIKVSQNINKDKITLGSVSRLHSVKNIDLMVRIIKELKKNNLDIELLIYGDGDEKALLRKYIEKQGCEGYIKLKGPSNNKYKIYDSITALISFSNIEGFGMTILESISFNKPVLYTDCSSGPRELMAPGTDPLNKTNLYEKTNVGYLVKPAVDVAAYSDNLSDYELEYVSILEKFINDVKQSRFSMEFDAEPFSEEIVVKKWRKVIDEA